MASSSSNHRSEAHGRPEGSQLRPRADEAPHHEPRPALQVEDAGCFEGAPSTAGTYRVADGATQCATSKSQASAPQPMSGGGKGQHKGQCKGKRWPVLGQKKCAQTSQDPPAAKAAPLKFSSGARPSRRGAPWPCAPWGPTQPSAPPPAPLLSGSGGAATPSSSATIALHGRRRRGQGHVMRIG